MTGIVATTAVNDWEFGIDTVTHPGVVAGVAVAVLVGVFVAVFVGVLVDVAVAVFTGVLVGVNVGVDVFVAVFTGVFVGVNVGVLVEVAVAVFVGVKVGVFVAVAVFTGVFVDVNVGVAVFVLVGVAQPTLFVPTIWKTWSGVAASIPHVAPLCAQPIHAGMAKPPPGFCHAAAELDVAILFTQPHWPPGVKSILACTDTQ